MSAKELGLEYIKSNSGRVWSAKLRTELDVWLGWIDALPKLDRGKKDEV